MDFQVVEDKILKEAPSYIIVHWILFPQICTMIWKGMQEGRWGSINIVQSKEITSILGGGYVGMGKIPPCSKKYKVTRIN
jgi:hypothetical protein